MSHYTVIKNTILNDREILLKTLGLLGYAFREKTEIQGHHNNWFMDVAVKTGGHYRIGFNEQDDGTYSIIADWQDVELFDGLSESSFVGKFYQTYNTEKITSEAVKKGYAVIQKTKVGEGIKLVLRKVA